MQRVLPLFLPLLLGLQDEWCYKGDSVRYSIKSTVERKRSRELLKYMDLCFGTYRKFLNPRADRLPRRKFTLILYRDREEYKKRGGSGRYGHYDGRCLVGYDDREQMFPTFAHEGMHQFAEICIPRFDRLPPWYAEGIAECIANNKVRSGKLYMCLKDGPVPRLRVPVVQKAIREKKLVKLKDLLAANPRRFQRNHELYYAESWLLCHFLLTYPRYEDPSKQIPNGRYKQVIVRFHNAMLDPKMKVQDAIRKAFVTKDRPLDLAQLEKEFRRYALGFKLGDD